MSDCGVSLGEYGAVVRVRAVRTADQRRDDEIRRAVADWLAERHGLPCRPLDGAAACYCPTCRRWRAAAEVLR